MNTNNTIPSKKKITNNALFAIITTVTLIIWVLYGTYTKLTNNNFPVVPEGILAPLDPNLDKDELDILEKKRLFSEEEIANFHFGKNNTLVPVPIPTETPNATSSAKQT